MISNTSQYFD